MKLKRGHMCCAYNCKERHKKGGISFHSFPKDPERRKVWTENLNREGFVPTDTTKICANHFKKDCFDAEKFGGRWLKPTAVPTIFDFSSGDQSKRPYRKRFMQKTPSPTEIVVAEVYTIHPEEFETETFETAMPFKRKRHCRSRNFKEDCSPEKLKKKCENLESIVEKQKKEILNMKRKQQSLVKKVALLSSMLSERKSLIIENTTDVELPMFETDEDSSREVEEILP